jgi:hypothetical protein
MEHGHQVDSVDLGFAALGHALGEGGRDKGERIEVEG